MVKWTICVMTVPRRHKLLKRLLKVLKPQLTDETELLVHLNHGGQLGDLMKECVEKAKGEYVSFVDDDDLIPKDFVKTILPLLDGVDMVGFKVRFTRNGELQKPVYHSLEYGWSEDDNGYYRRWTHTNPIKKNILEQGIFSPSWAADFILSNSLKHLIKTQHYIDREMYYYLWTDDSIIVTPLKEA